MANGFTLTELLISIAIFAIIGGITASASLNALRRNDLDLAAATVVQTARRAQVLAQAVDGDKGWGVFVNTSTITLFQGASFATRITARDEVTDVAARMTPTGLQEILFQKFSGTPSSTGSLILTSSINSNETRTITINGKGMLSY